MALGRLNEAKGDLQMAIQPAYDDSSLFEWRKPLDDAVGVQCAGDTQSVTMDEDWLRGMPNFNIGHKENHMTGLMYSKLLRYSYFWKVQNLSQ
jgi:hypothetical protein